MDTWGKLTIKIKIITEKTRPAKYITVLSKWCEADEAQNLVLKFKDDNYHLYETMCADFVITQSISI
jgi:phage-related protein